MYGGNIVNKKIYKTITIIATVVALIGLISFVGGIKPVNIGAFVFPAAIALWAFCKYRRV